MLYPVIMAGGVGRRLWPISTGKIPKQVNPFLDGETMLAKTYKRLLHGFSPEQIFVTTSAEHLGKIRKDLKGVPLSHYSIEPARRETAPALGLALTKLAAHDPKAIFVYVNADNFVKNEPEFHRALRSAEKIVMRNPRRLVLIGVRPTYAETGYGYIKIGHRVHAGVKDKTFLIDSFVEKPSESRAAEFVTSGKYLWNPTLIVGRASYVLSLYKKFLPELYRGLMRITKDQKTVRSVFPQLPKIDINRGILEHARGMLVLPAEFGWTDIGHWRSVHEVLAPHPDHNVTRGETVVIDSLGNLLFSESGKLVAAVGVHDTVLVETKKAILLIAKSRAHDVKKIIEEMEKRGLQKYL